MKKIIYQSLSLTFLIFNVPFIRAQNGYGYGMQMPVPIPGELVGGIDRYGREIYPPHPYASRYGMRIRGYDSRIGSYGQPQDDYRTGNLGNNRDVGGGYGRRYDGMHPGAPLPEPNIYGNGVRGYSSGSAAYQSGYGGYNTGPNAYGSRYSGYRREYEGNGIGPGVVPGVRYAAYRSGAEGCGSLGCRLPIMIISGFIFVIFQFIR